MRIHSSPAQVRSSQTKAFSLVEMMVAIGIASIVLMAVMQLSLFTARGFAAMGNYVDLDRASQNALDNMSREIRQAKVLGFYNANSLFFTNMDGSSSWFGYVYDPGTKTLNRWSGSLGAAGTPSQATKVLGGCDYFSFRIWLRNPTNQFWFPYSANGQANLTKLVDVSWRCSRRVLAQFNTESVQTAKIVLRN